MRSRVKNNFRRRPDYWHQWFAWYPVRVYHDVLDRKNDHDMQWQWAWLETIEYNNYTDRTTVPRGNGLWAYRFLGSSKK